MSWFFLILAGIAEIGFTIFLKKSEQFTKLTPTILFLIFSAISFLLMSKAMKNLPLGIVYAVWTGIGVAGTVVIEILYFHEPFSILKLFFITMMLLSIIGLKLCS